MKKKQKEEAFEAILSPSAEEAKEAEKDSSKAQDSPKESDGETGEERMEEDIALFHELFPQVKAKDIPQEVWDRVEKGESLAASYALYTVKGERREEKIRRVNEKNEKTAPPRIRHDGTESEYFSPEAVKAMTRSEIKKHYDAILRSMDKWN